MSGGELAALIVAITGALGAIFAGVRNLRSDRVKEEVAAAAAILAGYTSLATSLQVEIERIKGDCELERREWTQQRADLRAEHVKEIKELREAHKEEMLLAYERIDQLGAQLYVALHRPPETRERETDQEAPDV